MIPFRLTLEPGIPICDQVVYAAKRAIVAGYLRPGDAFPSVRALSRELKINPNTAHKVVAQLLDEGLLEVKPGIGTAVRAPASASSDDRSRLLNGALEQVVVEAKRLGLSHRDLTRAMTDHWRELDGDKKEESKP
jgi:DNA-binding transcriptional regulator YhcF (GntR family)